MKITKPNGTTVNQVTWQKPEVWMIDGYKCYMYQSSNQWLNWRALKVKRPDGSILDTDIAYKTNISTSKAKAIEWLKTKIEWEKKTPEERTSWIEENSPPQDCLW